VLRNVTATSYLLTVGIALVAALATPWLNVRRLRAMNILSTLRSVEARRRCDERRICRVPAYSCWYQTVARQRVERYNGRAAWNAA
jgi:hypothetical protein